MPQEKWFLKQKKTDFYGIAEKLSVSPYLVRIMCNRGMETEAQMRRFLYGTPKDMHDPGLLPDITNGMKSLLEDIKAQKHIRIIGDYDVDGVTSTYILATGLELLQARVSSVIPHRIQDGYGLNANLIRAAREDGAGVILTCDNGISAFDEIELANSLGMDVYVTKLRIVFRCGRSEHIEQLPQQLGQRIQLTLSSFLIGKIDAYYNIGSHLAAHIHREVVHHTSVNEDFAFGPDRRENSGNGHRRAYGIGKFAGSDDLLGPVHQIDGNAGEWNRKISDEIERVLVTYGKRVQQIDDVVTADKACRQGAEHIEFPFFVSTGRSGDFLQSLAQGVIRRKRNVEQIL